MSILAQSLANTLNADNTTRINAEIALSDLFAQNVNTPLELATICVSPSGDHSVRQINIDAPHHVHAAGVALRKYILERWSPVFPKWRGTSLPAEIKEQVRSVIFKGLSDSSRKIRSASSFVISSIAHSDWPDHYPSLLNDLLALIGSGNLQSIDGALQVFTEFAREDLTEDQLLPVIRQLLPILLTILGQSDLHTALTRARAIAVFRQCVESLAMVKEQYPSAYKEAETIIAQWIDAFNVLLQFDPLNDVRDPSNWSPLAIRIQIYRTLNSMHAMMSSSLRPHLATFLSLSLSHFSVLLASYRRFYVSASDAPPPATSPDDPDQEISLPLLATSMFDLLSQAIGSGKVKAWLEKDGNVAIEGCVQAAVGWAEMTEDDEERWSTDANAFVADDDDETVVANVRIAAFDMMENLLEVASAATSRFLQAAIQRVVGESTQTRSAGRADWWKSLEATLAVLGAEASSIVESIETETTSGRPKPFDVESLLADIVPSLLSVNESPFLQGRAFVFASNFAEFLPQALAGRYLHATVECLEASAASIPVKVSAVKAIRNFCQHIDDAELSAYAPRIASDLGPFLTTTTEDALTLVLETLAVVLKLDEGKWLTSELTAALSGAILEAWRQNSKNPIILSVLTDVISGLSSSSSPTAYVTLVSQLLPALVSALQTGIQTPEESWLPSSALELIVSVLEGRNKGELGDGFVAGLVPTLFGVLRVTSDREVSVKGTEAITLIVRKACDQLIAWSDPSSGQSGLNVVLSFIAQLLSPTDDLESAGLLVGDLIIHLFRNGGADILPSLPELLGLMIRRIVSAKTGTFLQSLIVPFAYLIQTQRDSVISLLESINVSHEGSTNGLQVLLRAWSDNAEMFQGFWPTRVSTLALCEMLLSTNPTVTQTTVNGDLIIKPATANVIMTRSRTKQIPTEYAQVPFPVKALKIVLHDLQATSAPPAEALKAEEAEDDDGDEGWADEEIFQGLKKEEIGFLSDFLNDDDESFDGMEDEDLMADPISEIDMRSHLLNFIRRIATSNPEGLTLIASQLTEDEAQVIRQVVVG